MPKDPPLQTAAPPCQEAAREGWRLIGPAEDYQLWSIEPGLFCIEVQGLLTFERLLESTRRLQRHPGWRVPYFVLLDLLAHPDYDRSLLSVRRDEKVPPAAAMAVLTRSGVYRMVIATAALASRAVNGTRVSAHESTAEALRWLRSEARARGAS